MIGREYVFRVEGRRIGGGWGGGWYVSFGRRTSGLSACEDGGMTVRAGGEPWVYTPVLLSQNGHQNVSESFRKPAVLSDVLFDTQQDILSFAECLFF